MSYLQVPVKIEVDGTMEYRLVGPIDTPPTPVEGYTIDPESIEIPNSEDKYWMEYKIILP